jgi:tetratricopeptide (TPR) repeat protein
MGGRPLPNIPALAGICIHLISAGYIIIYATEEDPSYLPEVEKHIDLFEQYVNETGRNDMQWALEFCTSLADYWRGDLQASRDRMKKALDSVTPNQFENRVRIILSGAEVSREMEDYSGAFEYLEQLFELEPFSPEGHLEAARIYHAQGQTEKAIEHLKKALRMWENADPNHPRAKRARELAEQLRISS